MNVGWKYKQRLTVVNGMCPEFFQPFTPLKIPVTIDQNSGEHTP